MDKISKTAEEWREHLSEEEYRITRLGGTERAFSGMYWQCEGDQGTYVCRCCGTPLFASDTKYDSGSGWPSFYEPLKGEHIEEVEDNSLGMSRTEVLCAACDAHLGHVFEDGPQPTGLRYCINSASLKFEAEEE